jgi:hypothetical protein
MILHRRALIELPAIAWLPVRLAAGQAGEAARPAGPSFPSVDPALVREMVGVAHGNLARVRQLLDAHPALAKATWDWGYGDFETAIGAASHVGNRPIAELLLAAGAGPTIFSAAMLGQLDAVKALVAASPGIQRTRGPHGITLLAHARAGGPPAVDVIKYLEALGDADLKYANEPLTDADRRAVEGTYRFGPGSTDLVTIVDGPRGLSIARTGGTERFMSHLGGRVFHPPGAEAVRIRFTGGGERAATLVIEDGPLMVSGARVD